MTVLHRHAAVLLGVLALVAGLLGLSSGAATAAPTNLNVALSIANSPAWGDALEVTMTTNYPATEGVLILSRVEPNGSLTDLLTTDTEGKVTVDTRTHLAPGSHQLVATAIKEGVEKRSLERTATITKRPTFVTFVNATAEPQGDIKVRVSSEGTGFVPTGSVVFSAHGMVTTTVSTDSEGVATLSRPPVGTRSMTAAYQGSSTYAASTGTTEVQVSGYRATLSGTLSRQVIAAGDEVSIDLTIDTGDTGEGLPNGAWKLFAGQSGSTHLLTVASGNYSGTGALTVDMTEWARTNEGTWTLKLEYAGNIYVYPATSDVATLTVGPADQRPATTTVIESPAGGVMAGGELVVRVSSATGSPSGAVVLLTGTDTVVTSGTATDGVARLTLPGSIVPGVHQFRAAYAGSSAHQASTSATTSVTVVPFRTATIVEIVAPQAPVPLGGQLEVQVRTSGGAPVSGPVAVYDADHDEVADGTAVDGVATVTLQPAVGAGTWELTAAFLGTETHAPSESEPVTVVVVDPAARIATATAVVVPAAGVPVGGTLTVKVTSASGLPNGPVYLFRVPDDIVFRAPAALAPAPLATGTAVDGVAHLVLPATLAPGSHQLQAVYRGSVTHQSSESEAATVVVTAPTVTPPSTGPGTVKAASSLTGKVVGKRGKATLTLKVSAAVPATGVLQIRDGKRLVRTVGLRGGRVALTLKKLRKGKHRITVAYLGSGTVAGTQRTWTVRVR
ncbi:MAG TPA: Ig-like domain-containing protein [Nocardioides sp.]|uniref:Ig-like domain-containing protein n=1 Tax=Nocardioides sp. TaxID=35761 RepID=UPI002EDA1B99